MKSSEYPEEIQIRRNILMEYRGKMYSSEKTDEFRVYIIAVREPLGDFKNSEERAVAVGIPSEFPRSVGKISTINTSTPLPLHSLHIFILPLTLFTHEFDS